MDRLRHDGFAAFLRAPGAARDDDHRVEGAVPPAEAPRRGGFESEGGVVCGCPDLIDFESSVARLVQKIGSRVELR